MRIAEAMKKLPHIIVALFLLITPASRGKPVTSHTQSNVILKENTGNVEFSNTNELDNNASKNTGHNNLLSDLARISKDEETNVGNRQTIVGTEVSAATVKNSKASLNSNENSENSNSRTMVTSAPTGTESPTSSYFTSLSPTSVVTESAGTSANADNDMSLVRLSEPTHIVLDKSKDEENPFSKLITSNENAPEEKKSNDDVNKPQELSPLISERSQSTPGESSENKESAFTASLPAVDESRQQETKYNGETKNGQTVEDNSSANIQDDGITSGLESKNVDKGVKDAATDHVVVCAGEKQTISCPADTTLNITSVDYGYDSNSGCPVDSGSASCQANGVYPVVRSACQGQASCLLQSDGQEFGGMCPGQNNFLKVGYSCQNDEPLSSSYSVSSPPAGASPQPSASSYAYQTSPYIPHPVQSTQPTSYYNNYAYNQPKANSYSSYGYNQPKSNTYNSAYMNDNSPGKTNYPYGYYGNQNYYNYYNPPSQGRPAQPMGNQARPSPTNYYRYKPRSPPRNPAKRPRPAARPQPPRNNYGSLVNAQYQDYSNRYPQYNYNNYYNNKNNHYNTKSGYYNTRNGYYGRRYYDQRNAPYRQTYSGPKYPRNSYLGSCYACQNCQQCSEQAYCQGCPKCKKLPCNKKPPKEERYMDPIDSLVEEFGKKTKGMTPMEMSAVVISPAPKVPEIAHSLPLQPPPKPLEEDDDDDNDDDSDENEFTLSEDESNNHEIEDHESTSSQKKTSVSTSNSSVHSAKHKQSKDKAKQGEKRNKIYHRKHKVNKIYDDDDDEDGYDLKVYQNLLKKPKKRKIHRHKNAHSKRRKSRKRLSKRWYDENENLSEITGENEFDIGGNEDRSVESPYDYDGAMFW